MDKCSTCIYRAASGKPWKCEYISIVGTSRSCEPGDLCTEYIKGDRLLVPIANQIVSGYSIDKDINRFLDKFNHFN